MTSSADKYDVDAVADLIAAAIASALKSGGSYTYEDVRRRNDGEGWAYRVSKRKRGTVEEIRRMRLSEEALDSAWVTANRRVEDDAHLAPRTDADTKGLGVAAQPKNGLH